MSTSIAQGDIWENLISLNSPNRDFQVLGPAKDYLDSDSHAHQWDTMNPPYTDALARDIYPLPATSDRESYHGAHHFSYWASGLRDMRNLLQCARQYRQKINTYLDVGCASGRVLRHFAINSEIGRTIGCDINRRHVEWILNFLPRKIEVCQNTSIPTLPFEDDSVDLLSAFSVFTHIENFDIAWMMELKRILRPGGIAWITFLSEQLWSNMKETSTLYKSWSNHPEFVEQHRRQNKEFDSMVFRRRTDRSYSSVVFYNTEFLSDRWGRFLNVLEVRRQVPTYQDVMILQKPDRVLHGAVGDRVS